MTFLNAIFGFAMAAVSLPILIHLLNRRRSGRESFSSLEFLQEVTRRQRRRIQIRQWLLLALRCLIIALVVGAMMRPALRSGGSGAGTTTGVIALDTSFSMQAATESASHAEVARHRLAEIGELHRRGDRTQLVWPTDPPRAAFDAPVEDFGRVMARAERAPITYRPLPVDVFIEDAARRAAGSSTLNREIYVISDFQVDDWDPDALPELPENVRVYLVPVANEASLPNVAVTSASFLKASVQSGTSGAVRVSLANFTDGELSNYPVRVFAGDDLVGEGSVRVPAADLATADLALNRSVASGEALQIQISEDALSADDAAWVTPSERQTIRVLLVHGGTPDDVAREPYVRLALDPPGQVGERTFTVQEIPLRDFSVQADLDYDVFVLNNVERLSEGVLERLRLAHRDGAGVFVILGDRVDLRYYNTNVLDGFCHVTLEDPESVPGSFFSLEPEVPGHPLFEGFAVDYGEALTRARFTKVVRTRVSNGDRVLARFGELPAVVEADRFLLFTSSADLRWGNFPTGGSFLPFLHQSILSLASGSVDARQFRAGEPIELQFDPDVLDGDIQCLTPSGRELPLGTEVASGRVVVRTDPTDVPGVYRFTMNGEPLRSVAVHLDGAEGHLRYRDVSEIADRWGDGVRILGVDTPIREAVLEARHGREIWRELLMSAFVLLIAETVIGRVRLT